VGVFDNIKEAIWGTEGLNPTPKNDPLDGAYLGTDQAGTGFVPEVRPADAAAIANPVAVPASSLATTTPVARRQDVDVAAQLDAAATARGETLNWRTSIVDLMKVVGLDASLQERWDLAQELNYPGDTQDTAAMNSWLHKELLRRLAQNGGRVPAELLD
jgi:hypothetical protein